MQVPTRYGAEEIPEMRMATGKTVCPFCKQKTAKNEKVVYIAINSGPMGGAFICFSCAAQFHAELGNLLNPDPNYVKQTSPCDIENDPGIQFRKAMLGSIGETLGELGIDQIQIGNSIIDAKKPDLPVEPLVGYGDTIEPYDVVYMFQDGKPDYDCIDDKWCKEDIHRPVRILSYGSGQAREYSGEPDYHLAVMNAWGSVFGCSYVCSDHSIFEKRTFKKAPPECTDYFDLLQKWQYFGVKVFLDLPGRHQPHFVEVPKIIYFRGNIIKAATTDTCFGDLSAKKVLKWDKKWIYFEGLKNKNRIPIPDELPFDIFGGTEKSGYYNWHPVEVE